MTVALSGMSGPMAKFSARAPETAREARALRGFVFALGILMIAAPAFAADTGRDREHDYDPPVPGTYPLPLIKPAAGGALIDSAGKSLDLRELTKDRITVLSFIYTRCADG